MYSLYRYSRQHLRGWIIIRYIDVLEYVPWSAKFHTSGCVNYPRAPEGARRQRSSNLLQRIMQFRVHYSTVHRTDQRAWHLFKEGDSRWEEIADVSISWKMRTRCLFCEVHPEGNDNAILELGNSARKGCPLGAAVTVLEVGIHRGGTEIACQIWAEGIRLFYDPEMMVGSIFCSLYMGKQQYLTYSILSLLSCLFV